MAELQSVQVGDADVPHWVPADAQRYLDHTEYGQSIRALARAAGCHASTVLRQVRRFEERRDDPLVDRALQRIATVGDTIPGVAHVTSRRAQPTLPDAPRLEREARRVLRRLSEPGACLGIAPGMEKAVVVRELADGRTTRTAVLDSEIAEAMALKDWIGGASKGRILRYTITPTGRAALKRLLAQDAAAQEGFAEAPARFADQHRDWSEREMRDETSSKSRRIRYNAAESPLQAVARRRDRDGKPFLSDELVAAGERMREDFELAQLGLRVTQNWDRFLTGGERGAFSASGGGGAEAARDRVGRALRDLGPGLGDVVLRCCCFLEGMEQAEKRMGWSARSGKIVLRIALQRLKRHYDETGGSEGLIG